MSTSSQTQSNQLSSPVQTPQTIQIQLPSEASRPSTPAPSFQGDIGTFLVVIALAMLARVILGHPTQSDK